jgi:hypothetical protein
MRPTLDTIARYWRPVYWVLGALLLASVVVLGQIQVAHFRPTWDFWVSGVVPHPREPRPNYLHSPWYLAVCALMAAWGLVGFAARRPRSGIHTLLIACVFAGAYFTSDGRFSSLGLFAVCLCALCLRPWQESAPRTAQLPAAPQVPS